MAKKYQDATKDEPAAESYVAEHQQLALDAQQQAAASASNGDTKPKEPPNQRFRRLAEARLVKVERYMALLGNLGNRRQYDARPNQLRYVLERLNRVYEATTLALAGGKAIAGKISIPEGGDDETIDGPTAA